MQCLLSLVSIVKNEESNIQEVIETAKPWIDSYTIVDTGSTDKTKDIVSTALSDKPGHLHDEPWLGYAKSRNRALELANTVPQHSVFALVLSADEYLRNGQVLRDYLETHRNTNIDAFKIKLTIDDTENNQIRVFRLGSKWHYEDAGCDIHEFPAHSDPNAEVGYIPGVTIEHIVSDPEKRYNNIWENHIPLLETKLEENPDNERALIFLAASYETLLPFMSGGEKTTVLLKTISLYMRRLGLSFTNEAEKNYIKMRLLSLARETGLYNNEELLSRCNELCELDPNRPESHLLRLNVAMKCLPVRHVYNLAVDTANVAKKQENLDQRYIDSPISLSTGWKAHLIAAKAAKQINLIDKAKDHVKEGLALGGPKWAFDSILGDS